MKVLVINAGSSSLKYQLIDVNCEAELCKGVVDCIGISGSNLKHEVADKSKQAYCVTMPIHNHTDALQLVLEALTDKDHGVIENISEIEAVGHRVLHSGEDFKSSVIIDQNVLDICKKNAVLGPLHMPANIACIESCMAVMPKTPMVAVFDTGFHSTMPDYAYMYAINYEDYKNYKVRKYGFHGTSHKYVVGEAAKYLGTTKSKIITCHLGNGSSMAAVLDGKVVDTSMGLTPLEGMVMGTRSGDIDAAAVAYLAERKNMTADEITNYLNKKCGFLGLCGQSDFRRLVADINNGNEKAQLALNMFAYRIKKYIGSYIAVLGGVDCIVFTGGIGENASVARYNILKDLSVFGILIDEEKNTNFQRGILQEIHAADSLVKIVIIPTNEELVIARDAKELVSK